MVLHKNPNSGQIGDALIKQMTDRFKIPAGAQFQISMPNEDGSLTLVCRLTNAERPTGDLPYGYSMLDDEQTTIVCYSMLDNGGELQKYTGKPDCVIIRELYEKYGSVCPKHLAGVFSCVVYDKRQQAIFAAVDQINDRQLYFCQHQGAFILADACEPFFALPDFDCALHDEVILKHLLFRYMSTYYQDKTASYYKNIKRLPPGHCLKYNLTDGGLTISEYFNVREYFGTVRYKTDGEYVEAFREVFNTAVSSAIRGSDNLQIGSFHSGGMDSGAVSCTAAALLAPQGRNIITYTSVPTKHDYKFVDKNHFADESAHVLANADLHPNMQTKFCHYPNAFSEEKIDFCTDLFNLPVNVGNLPWIANIFQQAAADKIDILLEGAMGNFSSSYGNSGVILRYLRQKMKYRQMWKHISAINPERKLLGKVRHFLSTFRAEKKNVTPLVPLSAEYLQSGGIKELADNLVSARWFHRRNDWQANLIEAYEFMNRFVVSSSIIADRFGLILRDPTKDMRVLKFCCSIPPEQYGAGGMNKAVLRAAMQGVMADEVRLSRRKGVQSADFAIQLQPHWPRICANIRNSTTRADVRKYVDTTEILAMLDSRKTITDEMYFDNTLQALMRYYTFVKNLDNIQRD